MGYILLSMYVLSIHTEGAFFKMAIVSVKGKRMAVESLREGLIEDFNLEEVLRSLGSNTVELVSALSADQVMIRVISLPVKQMRQAKKAADYQIEELFPFKRDEASILHVYRKTSKGLEATLVGYQNTVLCQHLQAMKALGIDPDWTSSVVHGLRRFAEVFAQEMGPFVVFHVGWEETCLLFITENVLQKTVSIPLGYRHLLDLLPSIEEPQITRAVLEQAFCEGKGQKTPFYEQVCSFEQKLRRVVEFFTQGCQDLENLPVFYTGADVVGRFLAREVFDEVQRVRMIPHLEFDNDHLLDYAVAIGLCLDVIEQDRYTMQLRKGVFEPERIKTYTWQSCKRIALLSFVSSCVLFLGFQGITGVQKWQLQKKALTLVEQVQEHPSTYPQLSSLQSIAGVKRDLAKLLSKQKTKEAHTVSSLLVSECLQWLSQNAHKITCFTKVDFENQRGEKGAKLAIAFMTPDKERAQEFIQELERTCPYGLEGRPRLYPLQRENEYGISWVMVP